MGAMAKVIYLPARSSARRTLPQQPQELDPFQHLDLLYELLGGLLGVKDSPYCIAETMDYIDSLRGR